MISLTEIELDVILHDTEGLPLTWLLRGVTFAADLLLRGAPAAAREMGAGKTANRLAPVLASDSKGAALPAWSDLFPEGRDIFYEGNDPVRFVRQIQSEFGFSPASDPRGGEHIDGDGLSFTSHSFYCPSEHLDAIYGNNRFPVGLVAQESSSIDFNPDCAFGQQKRTKRPLDEAPCQICQKHLAMDRRWQRGCHGSSV